LIASTKRLTMTLLFDTLLPPLEDGYTLPRQYAV